MYLSDGVEFAIGYLKLTPDQADKLRAAADRLQQEHAVNEFEKAHSVDATYVCQVPWELGKITALRIAGGKVIAETESGTQMIVPVK